MVGNKKKETINILMNILSYTGEHQGRVLPVLIFLAVAAAPMILYIFLLSSFVPLLWAIIFELPWAARMALYFLGNEKEKLPVYIQSLNDVYESADDLVRVSHIYPDGMIEYTNGLIVYVMSAYFMTYIDDDALTIDIEEFLGSLDGLSYDITLQNVVDEYKLQNDMEGMKVYVDKDLMHERMGFYILQDKFCHENVILYRINFVVYAAKYAWKDVKIKLEEAMNSDSADVFKEIHICDEQQVSDIMSRDVCMNINLRRMLIKKYQNEDYKGSKVLYYGDDVPEEYQSDKEIVDMTERRITDSEEG